MTFRAVLFDWRGTLVATQSIRDWAADGLSRAGRPGGDERVRELVDQIVLANGANDRLDAPGMDADSGLHRRCFFEAMASASVDDEVTVGLYASESDYRRNPWAADAAPTIRSVKRAGLLVGVVSDIHFDIRPAFAEAGVADLIDTFALSFEVGAQKPSEKIYRSALDVLGVDAVDALMVGDRAHPDGGAVDHGLSVLLVPPLSSPEQRRLDRVLDLALGRAA